jgi:hypothetical protein
MDIVYIKHHKATKYKTWAIERPEVYVNKST